VEKEIDGAGAMIDTSLCSLAIPFPPFGLLSFGASLTPGSVDAVFLDCAILD
jgi:hypothetical protein